jgi:hypothetical protein
MDVWPWVTLVALGAYHGLNPAMGWLFAVSRGMQERSRRAVVRSLLPIAIGHELALVVVAVVVLAAAEVVDPGALHVAAAAVLFAFGIFRFVRPRAHPRWTTMRVNGRELTLWSFLMSSAHGAGLIVAPVLIGIGSASASTDADEHIHASADVASLAADGVGLALHVGAMVLVMGVVAVLVYDRLGVAVLRKAWLNTDQLWAAAFIVAAAITLFT